jgi:hypothetical protein
VCNISTVLYCTVRYTGNILYIYSFKNFFIFSRFVDSDPDWIRIQRHCGSGSGSVLGIRIRGRIGNPDPDPGARKLRNFSGKNALFSYLKKNILPLKSYEIALTTF